MGEEDGLKGRRKMQQEITVRENLHDYECQDCFGHELDVHGRCAGCGSQAVALVFRPTTTGATSIQAEMLCCVQMSHHAELSGTVDKTGDTAHSLPSDTLSVEAANPTITAA